MTDEVQKENEQKEEKSQARLDYEEGLEFLQKGEAAQAANMFHNALIAFEQDNDIKGVANASDKLCDICAEKEDYDNALKHFQRAFDICYEQGDAFSVFALDKKKAQLLADSGRHKEAINMYLDLIDEYQAMKNPDGVIKTCEKMADIYITMGKRDMAADCYRTAASIHQNHKHPRKAEAFLKKAEEISVAN